MGVSSNINLAATATDMASGASGMRATSSLALQSDAAMTVPDGQAAPASELLCWFSSVRLHNFRNYQSASLSLGNQPIVLVGQNGAGKTNMLEAISLLAPGRGMRRAKSEHLPFAGGGQKNWAVSGGLETNLGQMQLGSGVPEGSETGRRIMRRDGDTVSQADIGAVFSVSWLTPQMDGIFVDTPGARRRFLDRLVIAFDPAHIGRINRYDKLLRERTALLNEGRGDAAWFAALESNLAETAVAITAARQSLIKDLNAEAREGWFGFPGIRFELHGDVEDWLGELPAVAVEDRLTQDAAAMRVAGQTRLAGPHASDLQAFDSQLNRPAILASTGQQKALLIAAVLAHARLQHRRLHRPPVMLLDDVAAHLDEGKRQSLFTALTALGGQTWYSGTDHTEFSGLAAHAQFIRIYNDSPSDQTPKFEVMS